MSSTHHRDDSSGSEGFLDYDDLPDNWSEEFQRLTFEARDLPDARVHAQCFNKWAKKDPVEFMESMLKNKTITVSLYSEADSPIKKGAVCAQFHAFPDAYLADSVRNIPSTIRTDLHDDVCYALSVISASGSFFGTAAPSILGQTIHLSKYDRNDVPPPLVVRKIIRRLLHILPVGDPANYIERCRTIGHVAAFRERWHHVLDKSAGVCAEILFGRPENKGTYLYHDQAEDILASVLESSLLGIQPRFPMRAGGRGKPMLRAHFVDALFDPTNSIDRLIWVTGIRGLHMVTDATTRLSSGLKQSGVASYGLSPFKGGAAALYSRFGYLGPPRIARMARCLSYSVIHRPERDAYNAAMFTHQPWMTENLFGSGTDVKRMDSSMRAWYISMWSSLYTNSSLNPQQLNFARKNLFHAHNGGDLFLDERLCASVPEGATTGAAGVSTLESTYRWATDLLGVVLNVQLLVLKELKYLSRVGRLGEPVSSIDPQSDGVNGLSCREVGTGWLTRKRCFHHPRGQLAPASRSRIARCNSILKRGSSFDGALYPPIGPGSALFEALLPIVAYYYHNIVNGDDDWNTFPLAHFIPKHEWHKILDPESRLRWLKNKRTTNLSQGLAHKVVGQASMSEAFERMRLPSKLNIEKGVEGEGLRAFSFNSMRPVSDSAGTWSFAIKGMTMEDEFRAVSHPDEKVTSPIHTCLRMVGLSLLNPDPRCYELLRTIYFDILERHCLEHVEGTLDLSGYLELCRKEKSNSFYHLSFIKDDPIIADLDKGHIKFPSYEQVLILHGFPRHLYSEGSIGKRLRNGAPQSPGW